MTSNNPSKEASSAIYSFLSGKMNAPQYDYDTGNESPDIWYEVWTQNERMEADGDGLCSRYALQVSFDKVWVRSVNHVSDVLNYAQTKTFPIMAAPIGQHDVLIEDLMDTIAEEVSSLAASGRPMRP